MKDRYAYYPGCLASLSAKELDTSTRAVCAKLGVELVEMESTTCCGAGDIHEAKPDYYLHLNARILSQAEALGCDTLLTICNVCTLNLRQANKRLREQPDELARINENLVQVGVAPYAGGVEVRHLLWEISEGDGLERFKQIAVKSLTGLKVAPFYGCQILRPSKVLGFESADNPSSLERLIEACGAEPVDYASKIKCCGFPIILAREDVALGEAILPLSEAADAGADVMVTPCPLCHLSLDAWQNKAEKKAGRSFDMPVLHLAQLLGAAAGIREDELKFKRHVVRIPEKTRRKLLQTEETPVEAATT
jgi:succinate dehydrogenase / fumarate reductase cytochrome b subunit